MKHALLLEVHRYVRQHVPEGGVAQTAIPGLTLVQAFQPSGLEYAISRPLACLVLQGGKQVMLGTEVFSFSGGDSLLITADVPTISQITQACPETPYLSLVLELDLAMIAALAEELQLARSRAGAAVLVEQTDAEVAEAALRLMHLLGRPSALPVLGGQMLREMHYWLLIGRHGAAIRRLARSDSHAQRVAPAVALLRAEFARPLPMTLLASEAGMSPSSFYQHFRQATSLSPLQFQKQLRLIEARRLMTAEDQSASSAAYAVGYESVQQFTREFRRLFGRSPGQERQGAKRGEVDDICPAGAS